MRPALRLILLLIFAIALRGFSASAYAHATPAHADAAAVMAAAMADCPEHAMEDQLPPATHHTPDDKACQISCDLAAAPGLPASLELPAAAVRPVFTATRRILALSAAPPPDHPPPIR